jgi:hypothetical protein
MKATQHSLVLFQRKHNCRVHYSSESLLSSTGLFPLACLRSGRAPYHVVVARVGIAVVVRAVIAIACSKSTDTSGRHAWANQEPGVYRNKTQGVSGPAQEGVLTTTELYRLKANK